MQLKEERILQILEILDKTKFEINRYFMFVRDNIQNQRNGNASQSPAPNFNAPQFTTNQNAPQQFQQPPVQQTTGFTPPQVRNTNAPQSRQIQPGQPMAQSIDPLFNFQGFSMEPQGFSQQPVLQQHTQMNVMSQPAMANSGQQQVRPLSQQQINQPVMQVPSFVPQQPQIASQKKNEDHAAAPTKQTGG